MSGETREQSPIKRSEECEDRARPLRRWLVRLVVVGAAIGTAVGGWLWFRHLLDGPVSLRDFAATVIIVRGSSYRTIVERVRSVGLLPHPFVFDYLAWRRNKEGHLKPGRYSLRSTMSVRQIYDAMIHGAPIRITVPEGWTIRQVAARLADEGLLAQADAFTSAACDVHFLSRHKIEASSAEGYILPDTYLLDPGIGVGEILETMVASFERQYAALADKPRPEWLASWHQVVTLASMIEREARNDGEKPLIASVYCNRLRRGMALDCDATVRYATSKWREPLTRTDLQLDSPYNTYVRKGLPPGPISCVGRTSLEAALSPARSEFFYYCYRGDGSHQFSKTLVEHERAVEKYLRKGLTEKKPER